MKSPFYRIVLLIAGPALFVDGLALADFLLHPMAQDCEFHSTLYRRL